MRGRRVVLTGASRGIGRETAIALGKMGASLSLVVRDGELGRKVAGEIDGGADVLIADLSSMADVRRVAKEILEKHETIDVLLNNAGAILMDRIVTKDGYEATFATNHLAYFLLTKLLLGAVKRSDAGRIVNVASEAHRRGTMKWDDIMLEKGYFGPKAYCQSKLANILFTNELARRLEGTNVTANSLHPGVIASGFARNNVGVVGFLAKLVGPFLMTSEDGAKTSIFLASDPSVAKTSGKYFDACREKKPSREARDEGAAKRLWELSETLV